MTGTLVLMATAEERLDTVEQRAQEDRHAIQAGLEGLSLGLHLTYADTQAIRADVGELRRDVTSLRGDMGEVRQDVTGIRHEVGDLRSDVTDLKANVSDRLERVEATLAEVLRRLPEPPA